MPSANEWAEQLKQPAIRLFGKVDDTLFSRFLEQLADIPDDGVARGLELTTTGGDAETARRIAEEIRLARRIRGLNLCFIGKTVVYSAGVTIMAAFPPERRALSSDTVLLVHERRLEKDVKLQGPLRASRAVVQNLLAEIETGQALERQGFQELVQGSQLSLDQLMAQVMDRDWYVGAGEALRLKLVGHLI